MIDYAPTIAPLKPEHEQREARDADQRRAWTFRFPGRVVSAV